MADAEYRVRIGIEADIEGANQSVEALDRVESKVDDLRGKLNKPQQEAEKPLAEIPPAAESAKKKLEELNTEAAKPGLKPVAQSAAEAKGGLEQVAEAARQAIGGVQASGGSFEGLGRVLKTLREDAAAAGEGTQGLSAIMGRLGPIVAAALASFSAGRWLAEYSESLSGAEAETREKAAAIAAGLHQAAETKVRFSGIEQAAKDAIAQIDTVLARMDQLRAAEQRTLAAETRGKTAEINQRAAVEMAGAETQAQKDAIRKRADAEIMAAQSAAEIVRLESEQRASQMRHNDLVEQKNITAAALAKVEAEAAEKVAEWNARLDVLLKSGLSRQDALQDPKQIELGQAASSAQREAQKQQESGLGKQLEDLKAATAVESEKIETIARELQAARMEQQTKAVELGAESQRSVNDLKAALDANTAAQAVAKERLAAAQASQGPVEQGVAFASLQRLEEEGRKLKAELDRQSAFVAEAQEKYRGWSAGMNGVIQETATSAVRAAEQAEKTKAEVKKSTDDVVGAAGELTKATTGATAQMSGAVTDLGKQVTGGFQEVSTQIQRMAAQTAAQLQSMQSQIDRVAVVANGAADNAAVALARQSAGR